MGDGFLQATGQKTQRDSHRTFLNFIFGLESVKKLSMAVPHWISYLTSVCLVALLFEKMSKNNTTNFVRFCGEEMS